MTKRKFMRILAALLVTLSVGTGICRGLDKSPSLAIEVGAVYEPYSMTKAYRSGRYYENLSRLNLSGDRARDVLSIAMSQLGYHEGDSDADMHGTSRSGTRDFVEYNVLAGKYDNAQGNGLSYGYYWCASFVNWCLRMAGVSKEASGGEVSCQRWYADCKSMGILKPKSGYTPASGDIIFFRDSGSAVSSTHVGLVRYSDGVNVYTIEGNTSNGDGYSSDGEYVALKEYPMTSRYIVGYANPRYGENSTARSVDYSGGFLSLGEYIGERELEFFSDPELKTEKSSGIKAFSVFSVTSVRNGALGVTYDGKSGYIDPNAEFIQLTTSENVYVTNYMNEDGSMLFLPQYRRAEEPKSIYSNSPKMPDRGFVEWVSVKDPAFRLCAGEIIPEGVGDLTLSAIWDLNSYTVTFKYSDGTIIDQVHGYYGTEYTVPSPETRGGEIFTGFDGSPDGVIRGNATHSAVYVPEGEFVPAAGETDTAALTGGGNGIGCGADISGAWFAVIATAIWSVTFLNRKRLKH